MPEEPWLLLVEHTLHSQMDQLFQVLTACQTAATILQSMIPMEMESVARMEMVHMPFLVADQR